MEGRSSRKSKGPDDVLDLLLIKLCFPETWSFKTASCLEPVFSLETISAIYGSPRPRYLYCLNRR